MNIKQQLSNECNAIHNELETLLINLQEINFISDKKNSDNLLKELKQSLTEKVLIPLLALENHLSETHNELTDEDAVKAMQAIHDSLYLFKNEKCLQSVVYHILAGLNTSGSTKSHLIQTLKLSQLFTRQYILINHDETAFNEMPTEVLYELLSTQTSHSHNNKLLQILFAYLFKVEMADYHLDAMHRWSLLSMLDKWLTTAPHYMQSEFLLTMLRINTDARYFDFSNQKVTLRENPVSYSMANRITHFLSVINGQNKEVVNDLIQNMINICSLNPHVFTGFGNLENLLKIQNKKLQTAVIERLLIEITPLSSEEDMENQSHLNSLRENFFSFLSDIDESLSEPLRMIFLGKLISCEELYDMQESAVLALGKLVEIIEHQEINLQKKILLSLINCGYNAFSKYSISLREAVAESIGKLSTIVARQSVEIQTKILDLLANLCCDTSVAYIENKIRSAAVLSFNKITSDIQFPPDVLSSKIKHLYRALHVVYEDGNTLRIPNKILIEKIKSTLHFILSIQPRVTQEKFFLQLLKLVYKADCVAEDTICYLALIFQKQNQKIRDGLFNFLVNSIKSRTERSIKNLISLFSDALYVKQLEVAFLDLLKNDDKNLLNSVVNVLVTFDNAPIAKQLLESIQTQSRRFISPVLLPERSIDSRTVLKKLLTELGEKLHKLELSLGKQDNLLSTHSVSIPILSSESIKKEKCVSQPAILVPSSNSESDSDQSQNRQSSSLTL